MPSLLVYKVYVHNKKTKNIFFSIHTSQSQKKTILHTVQYCSITNGTHKLSIHQYFHKTLNVQSITFHSRYYHLKLNIFVSLNIPSSKRTVYYRKKKSQSQAVANLILYRSAIISDFRALKQNKTYLNQLKRIVVSQNYIHNYTYSIHMKTFPLTYAHKRRLARQNF